MRIERKPDWLKIRLPGGENYTKVAEIVETHKLHTICSSGKCPNMGECWAAGTATFMILGDICTRACKFCAVKTGRPLPVDFSEADNVANSVKLLNLRHCVITSVDRDDLKDGGAELWALTIKKVKELCPDTSIEALIPDFDAKTELIDLVIDAKPEIISHNLETISRLTPLVRSKAKYDRSLIVIEHIAKSNSSNAKSGIMLGLGETFEEVLATMDDLLAVGCKIMTIGQYLQPTRNHLKVERFVSPEEFAELKEIGLSKGFEFVESAPLVRSSYHAERHIKTEK